MISSVSRIDQYARDVLSGEIVAGPHVRNACRRHLDDREKGEARGLVLREDWAGRAFQFFEDKLKLSEGQFEGTPFNLDPSQAFIIGSLFGWQRKDGTRRFRRAYVEQGKGNGKPICLETPIPTPSGWARFGDMNVGDELFDERGNVCKIVAETPVMIDEPCYLVRFNDGSQVKAGAGHLWVTSALRTGLKKGPKPASSPRKGGYAIRTTEQIANTLMVGPSKSRGPQAKWNHRVDVAGALSLPDRSDLQIPPYALGAWLGDGSSGCNQLTQAYSDWELIEHIESEGVLCRELTARRPSTAKIALGKPREWITALRAIGVLNEKHIPINYLRASERQRLALLQGLMDTDGTVSKAGQCELTLCSSKLAEAAIELIVSLGLKATRSISDAKIKGRVVGTRHRISFFAYKDRPVFRLSRKAARLKDAPKTRSLSKGRMIVACDRIDPVPVKCITVDSPNSMFLCGRGMIPTHNSPMAGGIGLYGLMADHEAGSQVYSAAAKREQAGILFADAVKMVKKSPALKKRLAFSGGEGREYNIAFHRNSSFFRPVSKDTGKTGSGPRPYFVLADEVHELPDGKILEMLERGFKFRRQPLLFMITNSGSDRNSICWAEHEWAIKVAAGNNDAVTDPTYLGEVLDDSTFSYVCALDDGDLPLSDPSCWVKANPLLGVTITEEYLQSVVAQAKNIPAKQNGILRLHFCVWTDADAAWMSREVVEPLMQDFDVSQHKGSAVAVGLDLSQNRDITAAAFVVKTGEITVTGTDREGKKVELKKPTFDAWIEAWTPGDTMQARSERDKIPYPIWAAQGHIHAPDGETISYRHVAQTLVEYDQDYKVQMVAYDRYAFRRFEEDAKELKLSLPFVEHPQGGTKKGKPTEEMEKAAKLSGKHAEGLWFPGSLRLLEDAMLEGRIRFKRNPVLISAIMSAVTEKDKWDNSWLAKQKSINKIDPAVAMVMAFGAANAIAVEKKPLVLMTLG